jgi:predicted enzyme related to lactoylglutathione lyase
VKISGIGGVFFRAQDPKALGKWYEDHFGIPQVGNESGSMWEPGAGITVFSPFKADTDYFGSMNQQFMLNFRVDDMDAALEALAAAGVQIDENRMEEVYGRFAWVYDPEGNKIELWQPIQP